MIMRGIKSLTKRMLEEVVAYDFLNFLNAVEDMKNSNIERYGMFLERGKWFLSNKRGRDFADIVEDLTLQEIKSDNEIVAFFMAVFLSYMLIKR